ncbi:terminase small subunit protein [Brucella sp. TWI559]
MREKGPTPEQIKAIADRAEARAGQPVGIGRPTKFTEQLAAHICAEISSGISLRTICGQAGIPSQTTVFRWLSEHKDFREQYARAREAQMEAMAEDILEIADEGNEDDTQRAKLRIDARKWLMSKMAPKKYGDKLAIGGDAEMDAIKIQSIKRVIVDPKAD